MLLNALLSFVVLAQTPAPLPKDVVRIDQSDPATIARSWRPVLTGIDRLDLAAESPRLLRGHAVRVDLQAPGLSFLAAPSNGDKPLECDSLKTSTFLKRHGLQVAINCAPFSPVLDDEGKPQDVIGLSVSKGEVVSPAEDQFAALLISKGNRARVVKQSKSLDLTGVENACGGFDLLLEAGQVVGKPGALHPRSAAGITKDERYLILLVIDGRQKNYSLGTSLEETAQWLQKLGAWNGLNLDGGGSTSLVMSAKPGQFEQVNRPIHQGKPGTERPCPNHLGIFAQPLAPR